MSSPSSVLIVDDSSMMRTLLTRLVGDEGGFIVAGTANDGLQAIERARELQPDLCLLDLEMPVMGGLEALPAIRAVSGAAVVVVSSIAGPGSPERRACLLAGAAAVVAKPSGAVSADLAESRGAAILAAMRAVLAPPCPLAAPADDRNADAIFLPAETEEADAADDDDDLNLLSLLGASFDGDETSPNAASGANPDAASGGANLDAASGDAPKEPPPCPT